MAEAGSEEAVGQRGGLKKAFETLTARSDRDRALTSAAVTALFEIATVFYYEMYTAPQVDAGLRAEQIMAGP